MIQRKAGNNRNRNGVGQWVAESPPKSVIWVERFNPELAEKIILAFSKENDVVLDIFSGSGTTVLEARKLGRQAKGIEINPLAMLIAKVKV